MRTITKKIISLFFILLGLVPLLFVLLISIKKQDIRHRMKEDLKRQHLQTVVLPENEINWMNKHEIWVNNHLFDIHTKKLTNGIYIFTGLYDEEETMLVEQERSVAGKNNEQNKLLTQLFKCLPVFYNQPGEVHKPALQQDCYISLISQSPVNQFSEILTPPPQVCC